MACNGHGGPSHRVRRTLLTEDSTLVSAAWVQLSQSPVGWEEASAADSTANLCLTQHISWDISPGREVHARLQDTHCTSKLCTVQDGQPTHNPAEQWVHPHKSPGHSAQPGCPYTRLPKAALISQEYLCSTVKATRCVLQALLQTCQPSPKTLTMTSVRAKAKLHLSKTLQFPPPHRRLNSHRQMLLHLLNERHNEVPPDE